jgi:hypothetical protein
MMSDLTSPHHVASQLRQIEMLLERLGYHRHALLAGAAHLDLRPGPQPLPDYEQARVTSSDNSPPLLTCPVCGSPESELRHIEFQGRVSGHWRRCLECPHDGPFKPTALEADIGWNRRGWNRR